MTNKVVTSFRVPFHQSRPYVYRAYKAMPRRVNAHCYVNAAMGASLVAGERSLLRVKPGSVTVAVGGWGGHSIRLAKTESRMGGIQVWA